MEGDAFQTKQPLCSVCLVPRLSDLKCATERFVYGELHSFLSEAAGCRETGRRGGEGGPVGVSGRLRGSVHLCRPVIRFKGKLVWVQKG